MATKKPAPKSAAKKVVKKTAPTKKVVKPVAKAKPVAKKAAPTKKVVKPVVKAKPVAKKPVAKKAAPAKKVVKPVVKAKPVAKKTAPAKKVVKPVAKSKPAAKKAAPAKKVVKPVVKAKPVAKKTAPAKKVVKPVAKAKPIVKKAEPVKKVVVKQEPPKVETAVVRPLSSKKVPAQTFKPVPIKKDQPKKPSKVVIPKIMTEKRRKYEPDFTKSILDLNKIEQIGPVMRYSDNDLNEFREIINKKLEAAKKELAYLQGLITRKDGLGGDESDNRYMTMEDGSLSMEREQLSQMASRQITFIDHLEKAIMRIENKTYGVCRVSGKLIDKARLRAVPHATLSMEAKLGIIK